MQKDYYKTLGVPENASPDQIRKAFRKLAKKHHPDHNKDNKESEEKFKEINEANAILGDPKKREQYDNIRKYGFGPGPGGGGQAGEFNFEDLFSRAGARGGGARGGGGSVRFEDFGSDMGDVFSRLFSGGHSGASRNAPVAGEDIEATTTVPFDLAISGGKHTVIVEREAECGKCGGSGAAAGSRPKPCPACRGSGTAQFGQGGFAVNRPCPQCLGRGRIITAPCPECGGEGAALKRQTVEVKIPAGVADGQKIRLSDLGQPGKRGGPNGSLILTIQSAPHPRFKRKGDDIYSKVVIGFAEAALGTQAIVETLKGQVDLKIPPGTQPGAKLRLKDMGVQRGSNAKGDHFVTVNVTIPRKLTAAQRRILEEFRDGS
ncbi:MAG TPA: J domain-containing protein [Candidatus Brocadiia bacterium]|nr:J domain-containing protein [Candidatus Brocadiia bacterium]